MNKSLYSKMKYPIQDLEEGDSVLDLLDLKSVKDRFGQSEMEAIDDLDPEFVARYIVMMCSPGSPAIELYPNLGKRKTWVMSELGVQPITADGKYEDKYNNLLLNKIPDITRKISIFLTLQAPQDWAIMLNAQEELTRLLRFGSQDESGAELSLSDLEKKQKLIESARDQYESSTKRLTEHFRELKIENDLQYFTAITSLGIRHEEFMAIVPDMKKPKDQTADTIYPEVGN
jgi:hypothetical protein